MLNLNTMFNLNTKRAKNQRRLLDATNSIQITHNTKIFIINSESFYKFQNYLLKQMFWPLSGHFQCCY